MKIKETFYTISERELFSLCQYFIGLDDSDLISDTYDKIQQLVSEGRISQLKFTINLE